AVSQALGNLPFPPRDLFSQIVIGVREPAPFALVAKLEQNGCVVGLPAELTLKLERGEGVDADIVLNPPVGLPPTVPVPKLGPIPKGKNEIKVKLDINAKVPVGQYFVVFSAKGKKDGKEYTTTALPAILDVGTVPFDLSVEPAPVKVEPGGKAKLKITAVRKGGYDGPIALEVKNLPAKVTAAKATIAKGQTSAELEISAAADAPAASMMNVQVSGTATA